MSQTLPAPARFADQFAAGASACLPVVISVAAYGLVWGVLARGAGLSLLEVIMMSGLVFAGSAQFVALNLWTATHATLPIGPLVIAALIINLRYLLLTATLRPLFPAGKVSGRAWLMFFVSDENWAITMLEMKKGGGTIAFLLGVVVRPERADVIRGLAEWFLAMAVSLVVFGLIVPVFLLPAVDDSTWTAVIPRLALRQVPFVLGATLLFVALGVFLLVRALNAGRRKQWSTPLAVSRYREDRSWS